MGVRAWVAAGLLAAGLWAAPANAGIINVTIETNRAAYNYFREDYDPISNTTTESSGNSINYHFLLNYQLNTITGQVVEGGKQRYGASFTLGKDGHSLNIDDDYIYEVDAFQTTNVSIEMYPETFIEGGSYYLDLDSGRRGLLVKANVLTYIRQPTFFLKYTIAASVPEPSTWAMMLSGLLGLGFLAQRKRLGNLPGAAGI